MALEQLHLCLPEMCLQSKSFTVAAATRSMLNEANSGQMPAKCIVGPVIICQSIFDHHPAYIAAAVSMLVLYKPRTQTGDELCIVSAHKQLPAQILS